MGAARQLISNPELIAKLKSASQEKDKETAMANIASDLALNMGIPKENQKLTMSTATPTPPTVVTAPSEETTLSKQSKQRRKRGGTIMESTGLIV